MYTQPLTPAHTTHPYVVKPIACSLLFMYFLLSALIALYSATTSCGPLNTAIAAYCDTAETDSAIWPPTAVAIWAKPGGPAM